MGWQLMASRMRFEPDFSGYRAELDSTGVQGVLDDYAKRIQARATAMLSEDWGAPPDDEHFETGPFTTKVGAQGIYVRTHTKHAVRSQSKNKTLTKAFRTETG